MLTERQQWLFSQLGYDPAREKEIRTLHKERIQMGLSPKDFTQYLVKRLHARWAEQNRRNATPYLGD